MNLVYLTKVVAERNQQRYYTLEVVGGLFGNWGLVREWGRIGRSGRTRTDWFASRADACAASDQLGRQKSKRGYQKTG
jgi:predicted DNA-binding WGR domain protein